MTGTTAKAVSRKHGGPKGPSFFNREKEEGESEKGKVKRKKCRSA